MNVQWLRTRFALKSMLNASISILAVQFAMLHTRLQLSSSKGCRQLLLQCDTLLRIVCWSACATDGFV